jgi:hypothetical protein
LGRCWANRAESVAAGYVGSVVKRNVLGRELVRERLSTSAEGARNYCTGAVFSFQWWRWHLDGDGLGGLGARGAQAHGERRENGLGLEAGRILNSKSPPFAMAAKSGAPVRAEATEKSKAPAPRSAAGRGQRARCRRYKRNGDGKRKNAGRRPTVQKEKATAVL